MDITADPEVIGSYPHYMTNASGAWTKTLMYFGELGPLDTMIPPFVIDGSGRGHLMVRHWVLHGGSSMYYYATPMPVLDAVNLAVVIDHVYFDALLCDPNVYDQNCDNDIDVQDVQFLIQCIFYGGPMGCR